MVAWMLYVTAAGCATGLAAVLSERGLRHLGRPVRWSWAGAMGATIGLPAVVGWVGGVTGSRPAALAEPSTWSRIPAELASATTDAVLLAAWIIASLMLLGNVRLSAWTLRRNERSWRSGSVGGRRVLWSRGFGPGVIGATRPRIVLPEWVLDSAPSLKRLILTHEMEHARSRDTRLLLAGVALVILVPWCIPLWWQLHRLRGAIETDCDARVLAATPDPRGYANALVTVAGRRTHSLRPVATLAPGRGELARRIHLITAGARNRSKLAGLALLATAAGVLLGLSSVPAPAPPSPNLSFRVEGSDWSKAVLPREAFVVLSVEGEDPDVKTPED